MREILGSILVLVAGAVPISAMAQAGYPRLGDYDHCIRLQVERQVAGVRRSVGETEKERIAQAALSACQPKLAGAVADFKTLAISVTRGTPHEARAASSSDSEWRDKVVTDRLSLAKIFVSSATAPPPPLDESR